MDKGWCNNIISARLNKEKPHDFSICDIDGVCRKFYYQNGNLKIRLIIYESKFENEKTSQTQLMTLHELDKSIDWKLYDKYSGLFIFKGIDNNFNELSIYKVKESNKKCFLSFIKNISFDNLYKWISCKDI